MPQINLRRSTDSRMRPLLFILITRVGVCDSLFLPFFLLSYFCLSFPKVIFVSVFVMILITFQVFLLFLIHISNVIIPRRTPISNLHTYLQMIPIRQFIYNLKDKFFVSCPALPNPLIRNTGNYTLEDLHRQYPKYKHKCIKHTLP
jgi:hypothetical protein